MRRSHQLLLAVVVVAGLTASAFAERSILYFQGRSWSNWSDEKVSTGSSGWTNRTFAFDGNARLDSAATNTTVRNAIRDWCSGGNECVIICYSAGCLRTLKAIDDLYADGVWLGGLWWIEGVASAAGGSKLAEMSTKGLTGFLAKIFGLQEAIDKDLTPAAARYTWSSVQDAMVNTPAYLYHMAGKKNFCKKFLFVKFCTNKYVTGGAGDGIVGFDSAMGASSQGNYWDCNVDRYPDRQFEWDTACGGEDRDHFGMPGRGVGVNQPYIDGSQASQDRLRNWDDVSSDAECDPNSSCDNAWSAVDANFAKTTTGTQIASDTVASSSPATGNTSGGGTCNARCGVYDPARSCQCDAACGYWGDCCTDYGTTARCTSVNQ